MGFLAPIIGGIKAIGGAIGAFAGSSAGQAVFGVAGQALSQRAQMKAQAQAGQFDLARLRVDAIANGFNPLTVFNAMGGSGFYTGPGVPGLLSLAAGLIGSELNSHHDRVRTANNDKIANALITAQTGQINRLSDALAAVSR